MNADVVNIESLTISLPTSRGSTQNYLSVLKRNPILQNRYSYVGSNPLNGLDPTGLFSPTEVLIISFFAVLIESLIVLAIMEHYADKLVKIIGKSPLKNDSRWQHVFAGCVLRQEFGTGLATAFAQQRDSGYGLASFGDLTATLIGVMCPESANPGAWANLHLDAIEAINEVYPDNPPPPVP